MESLTIKIIFDTGKADKPVDNTTRKVKAMEGSLNDLRQRLKDASNAMNNAVIGTKEYGEASKNVATLTHQLANVQEESNRRMQQSTRVSANMGQALLSMNYVVRDSPYFFRNFSLGVLAIGNNLNPLIDSMLRAKKEAQALGSTLGRELLKSLTGTGGIIFGMSLLVSAIQAVVFWMDNQKSATKETKEEIEDLSEAIASLNASLEQLGKQKIFSEKELKGFIKQQEQQLELYKRKVVGLSSNNLLTGGAFGKIALEFYKEQISVTEESIRLLKENLGVASVELERYKGLMQGLLDATKGGSKGILEFAKANKLSKDDLSNLASILSEYKDGVLAYGGETSKYLTESQKEISKSVKITVADLEKAIPVLQSFLNPKENKGASDKTIKNAGQQAASVFEKYISDAQESIEKLTDSFNKEVFSLYDKQQKAYKEAAERLREESNKDTVGFTVQQLKSIEDAYLERLRKIDLALQQSNLSDFQRKKLTAEKESIEKELGINQLSKEMEFLVSLSDTLGKALYDSFTHGKEGLSGFLKMLQQVVLQMIVIDGLKSIFTGKSVGIIGFLGGLLGFANGGIIPKAENGLIGGTSYMGDRQLVRVNSGEMILNKAQQKNLFDIASGKFSPQKSQSINVNITGSLKANRNDFVAEIKKGLNTLNRNVAKVNV